MNRLIWLGIKFSQCKQSKVAQIFSNSLHNLFDDTLVPLSKRKFLEDQQDKGLLFIGSEDRKSTKALKN